MSIMDDLFGPIAANDNKERVCPICYGEVTGHALKKYCGKACARKAEGLVRDYGAAKERALARAPEQRCERCGDTFKGVPKEGKPLRFCARHTKQDNTTNGLVTKALKYGHGIKPASYTVHRPLCPHCGVRFTANGSQLYCTRDCGERARRHVLVVAANDNAQSLNCRECEKQFTPLYGDKRKEFCSKACSTRTFKRIQRRVERARLRVAKVENVDPTKVFERDGWRCQLCGIKTPRKLRGTIEPNAPELDHIMPVSLGGEHSYANTHCACRECNIAKGATPKGQMLLFG